MQAKAKTYVQLLQSLEARPPFDVYYMYKHIYIYIYEYIYIYIERERERYTYTHIIEIDRWMDVWMDGLPAT